MVNSSINLYFSNHNFNSLYYNVLLYLIGCSQNYDVESGEISSPRYSSWDKRRLYCTYTITVPRGRMITVEIIKGKSIAQSCDTYSLPENDLKEKLIVSVKS